MIFIRLLLTVCGLLLAHPALARNTTVPLGDKKVTISLTGSGRGPTCVALHSNETTAIRAVEGFCGKLIVLKNGGARDVTFTLGGVGYRFDPNRIFTPRGLKKAVKPSGNPAAEAAVAKLAEAIRREFSGSPLIGLHNNSNGGDLSILSYQGGRAKVGTKQDPDNFVLTTSTVYYFKALNAGYNAILEPGRVDDGSLSVYAKNAGRSYINVEAQHGALAWQRFAYQTLLQH